MLFINIIFFIFFLTQLFAVYFLTNQLVKNFENRSIFAQVFDNQTSILRQSVEAK